MGALALFISLGGVGYAATELRQADTQITACIEPANGQPVKIITSGSCDGGLTPVTWNQTGPQGPQGPVGPVGPAGQSVSPSGTVAPTLEVTQTAKGKFSITHDFTIPGNYLVEAHTRVVPNQSGRAQKAVCSLSQSPPFKTLAARSVAFKKGTERNDVVVDLSAIVTVQQFEELNALLIRPGSVTWRCSSTPGNLITFKEISLTVTQIKLVSIPKPAIPKPGP